MSDLLGNVEGSLATEASKQAVALLAQYLSRWNVNLNALIKERIKVSDLLGVYSCHSHSYGLDGQEIWRLESKERGEGPFRLYTRGNVLPPVLWVSKTLVDGRSDSPLKLA